MAKTKKTPKRRGGAKKKAGPASPLTYSTSSRPRTRDELSKAIAQNADAYVASLMAPFEVTGARVPDASAFPSSVGSLVKRYTVTGVIDAKVLTNQYAGMFFGLDPTEAGVWTATVSAVDTGNLTWTSAEHPYQSAFTNNFHFVRTVSMGVRVVNIAKLVDRGGALFVSYTTEKPEALTFVDLKQAKETRVFDLASLTQSGLEAVWIPMCRQPVKETKDSMSATGSTYINPAIQFDSSAEFVDANIVIWVESSDDESLVLEFEQVHNYEAIPWPYTEYLFDRKSIVGSEETNVVAMQNAATAVNAGVKAPNDFRTHAVGSLLGAGARVLDFGIKQLESLAVTAIGGLFGALLGSADFKHHQIAATLRRCDLSPLNDEKLRGLTTDEFMLCLVDGLKHPRRTKRSSAKTTEGFTVVSKHFGSREGR